MQLTTDKDAAASPLAMPAASLSSARLHGFGGVWSGRRMALAPPAGSNREWAV
jgi:hypothetical protein